jgi:arylsulfatase A-like enzyme
LSHSCWHRGFPEDPHGLNPNEKTISEVLKDAGYATGCFGKWHLGDQPEFLPTNHGFDTYYGIPYSNDMWPLSGGAKKWKSGACPLPLLRDTRVEDIVNDMDDQAQLSSFTGQPAHHRTAIAEQAVKRILILHKLLPPTIARNNSTVSAFRLETDAGT